MTIIVFSLFIHYSKLYGKSFGLNLIFEATIPQFVGVDVIAYIGTSNGESNKSS